jgi:hypothetical protein
MVIARSRREKRKQNAKKLISTVLTKIWRARTVEQAPPEPGAEIVVAGPAVEAPTAHVVDGKACGCLDGLLLFDICFGVLLETQRLARATQGLAPSPGARARATQRLALFGPSVGNKAQLICIALLKGKEKQFLLHAVKDPIRASMHGWNSLEPVCQKWLDEADKYQYDRAKFVKGCVRACEH